MSLFSEQQEQCGRRLFGGGFLPIGFLPGFGIGSFQHQGPQGVAEVIPSRLGIKGWSRRECALNGKIGTVHSIEVGLVFQQGPAACLVELEGPADGLALDFVGQGELPQKDVLEDRLKDAFADHALPSDHLVSIEVQVFEVLWPLGQFAGDGQHSPIADAAALEADRSEGGVLGERVCQLGNIVVEKAVFRQIQRLQRRVVAFRQHARQNSKLQYAVVSMGIGQALPRHVQILQLASFVAQNLIQDILRLAVGHVSVKVQRSNRFWIHRLQEVGKEFIGKMALLQIQILELGEISERLVEGFHHMDHLGTFVSHNRHLLLVQCMQGKVSPEGEVLKVGEQGKCHLEVIGCERCEGRALEGQGSELAEGIVFALGALQQALGDVYRKISLFVVSNGQGGIRFHQEGNQILQPFFSLAVV